MTKGFTAGEIYLIKKSGTMTFESFALYDGWILEKSERGNKGGSKNNKSTLLYIGDNATKKQYRSILSFHTSALPDNATITKVTLLLKKNGVYGGGDPIIKFKGLLVDLKNGIFGLPALAVSDFQSKPSMVLGPYIPAISNSWYSIDLTSAHTYINKSTASSGLTQIRLRFKRDDNNNTKAEFLKLYSGNSIGNAPQLIIEYHTP